MDANNLKEDNSNTHEKNSAATKKEDGLNHMTLSEKDHNGNNLADLKINNEEVLHIPQLKTNSIYYFVDLYNNSIGNTPKFGDSKKFELFSHTNQEPSELSHNKVIKLEAIKNDDQTFSSAIREIEHYFNFTKREKENSILDVATNKYYSDSSALDISPRKKNTSLKHPLISRKSPLFTKFGSEDNSVNTPSTKDNNSLKMRLKARRGNITVDQIDQNLINNIINRAEDEEIDENQFENRNNANISHDGIFVGNNGSLNEKNRENFTFYSRKHQCQTPAASITASKEFGLSEQKLRPQNSLPEESNTLQLVGKTKSLQIDGNTNGEIRSLPLNPKRIGLPPPKFSYPEKLKNEYINLNIKPSTSHQGRTKNNREYNENLPLLFLKHKSMTDQEYEKEIPEVIDLTHDENFGKYVSSRQNNLNETHLILPNDSNTSIAINSKLDLSYQQNSNRLLRKSNSESNFNCLDTSMSKDNSPSPKPGIRHGSSPKNYYDPPSKRTSHLIFSKKNSFNSEASSPKAQLNTVYPYNSASKAHKNQTMYHINAESQSFDSFDHSNNFNYNNKKIPQTLRHRKIESAAHRLQRISDSQNNSFVEGYSTSILQPIVNNMARKKEVKAPKSEKSNVKHFSFLGTPLKHNFQKYGEEDKKNPYTKLNLPPKPGTSASVNNSFRKEKFRSQPRNFSSKKNTKQLDLDMSNFEESNSMFEDSSVQVIYNEKENTKLNGIKSNPEKAIPSPQYNRLVDVEKDNEIIRLKEELKKLQKKDNESQMKIAELHMQLENQNKEWAIKLENMDKKWRIKYMQQKEYYVKIHPEHKK